MEQFKKFEDILEPDARQLGMVIVNSVTGNERVMTLKEHHTGIASVVLSDAVPEDIQVQFTSAKHLLLYSWFVYRLGVIAELHAYATLELALGQIYDQTNKPRPLTLGPLLRRAISDGRIRDEAFLPHRRRSHFPVITGNPFYDANLVRLAGWSPETPQLETIQSMLPKFRNMFAHGSTNLWRGSIGTLIVVGTILNELYRREE